MIILLRRIKRRMLHVVLILILAPASINAQHVYPKNYFRSPVDFRILLSGTFGELRSGHFHSGIDIKTGGVTGKNIYAIADGYVSRIKVSANGFGKTLYITHPNGFVSVYAHLSRFNKEIAPYVKAKQYEHESYELNLYPEKYEIEVEKGEIIAYSGNSGGSNGPHLHFEIRLESTQTPVNPLLFGFEVKDYIRPEIHWLKVIPADMGVLWAVNHYARVYDVDGWGEEHRIKGHDTITVSGPFSLAINTYDKLNDANNKNGVYSISLFVDSVQVYHHDLEKFDFSETRYINSLIDYAEYVGNKRRYQRTEIDANNKLSIYNNVMNDGIIHFTDTALHKLEYVVVDFNGNISRLPFVVKKSRLHQFVADSPPKDKYPVFSCQENNEMTAPGIELTVPGKSLYRDVRFNYSSSERPENAFSPVHQIHDDRTPLNKAYTVRITPEIVPSQTDKLLLAKITRDGNYISYGGRWDQDALKASIRSFGNFVLLIDTIAPEIHSVNIASGKIKHDRKTVKVRIRDALSGIKKYRATLNGDWLLMEFDAKNNLLIYYIDERLKKGENTFRVAVSDQYGNEEVFEKSLIRE